MGTTRAHAAIVRPLLKAALPTADTSVCEAGMAEVRGVERVESGLSRTEIDGLPVYWSTAPIPVNKPVHAALVFRHGQADETLATSGRAHLIEHLALFPIPLERSQFGGYVDHTRTVFRVSGTEREVRQFLRSVTDNLQALSNGSSLRNRSSLPSPTPQEAILGARPCDCGSVPRGLDFPAFRS